MSEIPDALLKHIRRIHVQTIRLAEDILAGEYHSAFKGKGMEFEEVREYVEGDDVRSIDWNVTARMRSPHVKNFREERELTLYLVVDVSASTRFGSNQATKREMIAQVGGILAFSAIKNSDKVGLILFSDRVEKHLSPKKGLRHVLRIIRELLVYEPQSLTTNLEAALDFLGNVQKQAAICFVISDFLAPECPLALAVAAKRHDLIAVAVADPMEIEPVDIGLVAVEDLENGIEKVIDTSRPEWKNEIKQKAAARIAHYKSMMKNVGAGFIFLRTDHSPVSELRKFFKFRRVRH